MFSEKLILASTREQMDITHLSKTFFVFKIHGAINSGIKSMVLRSGVPNTTSEKSTCGAALRASGAGGGEPCVAGSRSNHSRALQQKGPGFDSQLWRVSAWS